MTPNPVSLGNVFGVWRSRIAGLWGEMGGSSPVLLADVPRLPFAVDEPSKRTGISETRWAEVGVAPNLSAEVVVGFTMPSNPYLSWREVEV